MADDPLDFGEEGEDEFQSEGSIEEDDKIWGARDFDNERSSSDDEDGPPSRRESISRPEEGLPAQGSTGFYGDSSAAASVATTSVRTNGIPIADSNSSWSRPAPTGAVRPHFPRAPRPAGIVRYPAPYPGTVYPNAAMPPGWGMMPGMPPVMPGMPQVMPGMPGMPGMVNGQMTQQQMMMFYSMNGYYPGQVVPGAMPAGMVPVQGMQDPSLQMQRQKPCFNFAKGLCQRGAQCKYSHDPQVIRAARAERHALLQQQRAAEAASALTVGGSTMLQPGQGDGDAHGDGMPPSKMSRVDSPGHHSYEEQEFAERSNTQAEQEQEQDPAERVRRLQQQEARRIAYEQRHGIVHQPAQQHQQQQQQQQGQEGVPGKPALTSKVVVIHVPAEHNNTSDLNAHFMRFGTIVDIHVGVDASGAPTKGSSVIEFSTPAEAQRAKTSGDAVFGNRFVQVHYATSARRPTDKRLGPVPQQQQQQQHEGQQQGEEGGEGEGTAPTGEDGQDADTVVADAPPRVSRVEQYSSEIKRLTDDIGTSMEVQKKQQDVIDKCIVRQKLLIKKLEDTNLKPTDKTEITQMYQRLKKMVEDAKKALHESVEKMLELQKSRDALMGTNQSRLATAPAAAAGAAAAQGEDGARGRGRGRGRARGRGRGGRDGVENLTTVLQVKGFPASSKDTLTPQFAAFGTLMNICFADGDTTALITFKDRGAAVNAMNHTKQNTALQIEWFEPHKLLAAAPAAAAPTKQEDKQEYKQEDRQPEQPPEAPQEMARADAVTTASDAPAPADAVAQ